MPGPLRVDAEGRRAQIAGLLLLHKSGRQIAHELGVGVATVLRDIKAIRAEWKAQRLRDYDEHVAEDLARLAEVEAAVLPQAIEGNLDAVDRELDIMKRRADLLGLDAPKRKEVSGTDGGPLLIRVVYDEIEPGGPPA